MTWVPRFGLVFALVAMGAWLGPEVADETAAPAQPAPESEAPVEPTAETEPEAEPEREPEPEFDGPTALDVILPCGVRLIAAQDSTLPVAAIVLAIEIGTEDDPKTQPGLVHAFAYHLLQGNRELPPDGIARIVHSSGGITSLAVGAAQIRFESLVPISKLEEVLRAEAGRLRAPTVTESLWRDSLSWARRDVGRKWSVPREVLAAAHGAPGLAHDGRKANAELSRLLPNTVSAMIADRFTYDRATLVVVAPAPPVATLATVEPLFADLPAAPRRAPERKRPSPQQEPKKIVREKIDAAKFVWPVAAGAEALARARVLCRSLNRQRRAPGEDRRARLRCVLDRDPRRAVLVLSPGGAGDPGALLQARMKRITDGADARLLTASRKFVREKVGMDIRLPLPLARALSSAPPRASDDESVRRSLAELSGAATLDDDAIAGAIAADFPWGVGVALEPPERR